MYRFRWKVDIATIAVCMQRLHEFIMHFVSVTKAYQCDWFVNVQCRKRERQQVMKEKVERIKASKQYIS